MALRMMDGFDSYATADLLKKWTTFAGVMTVNAGTGRRGTASARCVNDSDCYLSLTLDAQPTWILGMAWHLTELPSGAIAACAVYDGATLQADLRLNPDGTVSVTRNGTVLGAPSVATIPLSTYVYLEWRVTIHNSTGSTEVRLNGTSILALTAQDTQNTANATANMLRLGSIGTADHIGTQNLDDVYICDGTGAAPHNTFLGDCRVDTLLPTADGTAQQWTPSTPGTHYTLVDEAAPNTTDYVSSSTVGQRDTYGMQDLTAATGTIYGVQLSLAALKSDAGARSIKPLVLSGASEALATATALSTSQTYTRHVQVTDPATAAAWTEAGVNAAQAGAEVA